MNDIDLTTGSIKAASTDVANAAATVKNALAASNDALPFNAFGVMCSPLLLPPYMLVKAAADSSMNSASQALDRASKRLDLAALAFERVEEENNALMQNMGKEIPTGVPGKPSGEVGGGDGGGSTTSW